MHIIDSSRLGRASFTELQGRHFGTSISFILVIADAPGLEPELHHHPYPETFVMRSGQARFTIGDEQVTGRTGQIIVVPAYTPHTFQFLGPARLDMIDIHAHERFITTWPT